MRCDESVSQFGDGSESGHMRVDPKPGSVAGEGQQLKDGMRAAQHLSIGQNQLDGFREILSRDRRKLVCNLLRRRVVDPVARELFPVLDPQPAEAAAPVEDDEMILSHVLLDSVGGSCDIMKLPIPFSITKLKDPPKC